MSSALRLLFVRTTTPSPLSRTKPAKLRYPIALPEDVDPDRVEAHYRNGVLQIHIKRQEAVRPRQIKVKAA